MYYFIFVRCSVASRNAGASSKMSTAARVKLLRALQV